jgi:UDP-3-O-[3-hydroxymyristoyl] N-acetylglucosamine deacetylase
MPDPQMTLSAPLELRGVGVHTGAPCCAICEPADVDTGVIFVREDLEGYPEILAAPESLRHTVRSTALACGEARAVTVEHLLAGLYWMGVDNARIRLSGEEAPILDGSAQQVCQAVRTVGLTRQAKPRQILTLDSAVSVASGDSLLVAIPQEGLIVDCLIRFDHPMIGTQYLKIDDVTERFPEAIAPARTFGFLRDKEALQRKGFALGASLDNTVVLTEEGILNDHLRFSDEFVRHKILDLLGDLAVLGKRLWARIVALKPGHDLNGELVRRLAYHGD